MKIIVDAMGGDHAPNAIVKGAIDAAREFDVSIILVGEGETLLRCLDEIGLDNLPEGIEVAHASDVIDMCDDPTRAIRQHKDSSLVVGLRMLSEGAGDAMISAGSTGALLSGATLIVKRIKGVRRAAFGPVVPNPGKGAVLIDCGANVECTKEFLLQFACMGACYAEDVLKIENPRVALLNNGTEESKGTPLQKETYGLLKQASEAGIFNFIGNIEGREVPLGGADVVVADGFSGNVMLKSIEGTALFMSSMLKQTFKKNLLTKLSAVICKDGIQMIKSKTDYRETGGTALIGITKPVIKAHGSSDARAIRSAIRQAMDTVGLQLESDIQKKIAELNALKEPEDAVES